MSESESEYDDAMDTDEDPVMSPPLLMRSFLTIASSSVACLLIYAIIGLALAGLFFPDVWDALTAAKAEAALVASIPFAMLVPWLVLQGICSVGIGWLTAKVAPFAPNKHGLILAVFLFIGWVQKVFAGDPDKIQLNAAFAIVVPLAIAYGARKYSDRQLEANPDSMESSEQPATIDASEEAS